MLRITNFRRRPPPAPITAFRAPIFPFVIHRKRLSARPLPKSAREYLKYIGSLGGLTSRRGLTADQARKMVAIREAKRALIKTGKRELTRERWPLNVAARYTDTRKRAPRIVRERVPYRSFHNSI